MNFIYLIKKYKVYSFYLLFFFLFKNNILNSTNQIVNKLSSVENLNNNKNLKLDINNKINNILKIRKNNINDINKSTVNDIKNEKDLENKNIINFNNKNYVNYVKFAISPLSSSIDYFKLSKDEKLIDILKKGELGINSLSILGNTNISSYNILKNAVSILTGGALSINYSNILEGIGASIKDNWKDLWRPAIFSAAVLPFANENYYEDFKSIFDNSLDRKIFTLNAFIIKKLISNIYDKSKYKFEGDLVELNIKDKEYFKIYFNKIYKILENEKENDSNLKNYIDFNNITTYDENKDKKLDNIKIENNININNVIIFLNNGLNKNENIFIKELLSNIILSINYYNKKNITDIDNKKILAHLKKLFVITKLYIDSDSFNDFKNILNSWIGSPSLFSNLEASKKWYQSKQLKALSQTVGIFGGYLVFKSLLNNK